MMTGMCSRVFIVTVDQEAVRKTRPRDQPMTLEDLPVMTCSCQLVDPSSKGSVASESNAMYWGTNSQSRSLEGQKQSARDKQVFIQEVVE